MDLVEKINVPKNPGENAGFIAKISRMQKISHIRNDKISEKYPKDIHRPTDFLIEENLRKNNLIKTVVETTEIIFQTILYFRRNFKEKCYQEESFVEFLEKRFENFLADFIETLPKRNLGTGIL